MEHRRSWQYDNDNEGFNEKNDWLRAQQKALDRFRNDNNTSSKRFKRLEDEALSRAVEESLVEEQKAKQKALSEALAAKIHREELEAADGEMAAAIRQSEKQAQSEVVFRKMDQWAMKRKLSTSQEQNKGSWDCTACTLTNRPYSKFCSACCQKAPSHVLAFGEMPASVRFGVEVEMLVCQGKRDGFTLKSIADDLTRLGPPAVSFAGYTHETTADWKIVTDSSIVENHANHDLAFELVSPVLQGETGLEQLRTIMDHVKRLGIATNSSCGFHVHVDAEESSGTPIGSLQGLKRIAQCFVSLENAFDLLVALSWESATSSASSDRRGNSNRYCRSNRLAFGELSSRQRWERIGSAASKAAVVNLVNPVGDRYRKLNLTNIVRPARPSTCEFRNHGGVEDIQEAEAWVRLIVAFCWTASQCGDRSYKCLLPENAPCKAELRALFDLVSCRGLEQFFVVERKLFSEHRLRSDWHCPVCHRAFASSRSLSQHAAACGH